MAEHYVKITNSDLEDVLNTIWVAGPGAPNPGKLLSCDTTPINRETALALALDLSRRSTPADGGFCTYQPVVDGGSCPWKLDCENFVLSAADLLYWRRKAEQWRSIAENAPDDATADYLHTVFEPTAKAIKGLEQALAALGILDEALTLDLRRPQDYFHRTWSTAFRARDLASLKGPRRRHRTGMSTSRTDAAVRARRQATQEMLQRLQTALAAAVRDHTPVTVAALARTARVSRTFLYQNQQARALIEQVTRTSRPQSGTSSSRSRTHPAWRERALNAEDALTQTQREIRTQRTRIAELLGKIRDLEHDLPEGSLQRIVTENTTLKQHVRQLTQDNQRLQERLASARQNNRFLDKHIADLEAQLAPYLTTPPPRP
ncbi:DUF6262 family protein [Streptomyces sp. enrichment culture]|uniref:DUF6262 family protein n=1 Tax=Streptomyces sp. enrichment culture TaxID=1795815 RepID=UPI003F5791C6